MTATDHTAEFARRGIADWLKKPFDLDDLLDEVADRLGDQATDRPGHP
jgi:DNA-binding NtrC family response regulator